MASSSNFFRCFSVSSSSKPKRYICEGDVCVLRNQKKSHEKLSKNKQKHSPWISFSFLSMRRTPKC
ncbi:hypothetical protein RGQ29_026876 [Quercus rubra]|uniref:Uncharacterized protein n=1 Tax=Quercus rubra TaxID=3512 RepID=A0AAN7ID09_QUERU|nr:hypothetical protein RGQ29_026876 [Quercus rubra]